MAQATAGQGVPRWAYVLVTLFCVGIVLYVLRGVLTPIFFAFLIAYMLDPVVDRFEAYKLPRALGIAVMLTLVLGALVLVALLAIPAIARDVATFMTDLPNAVHRVYLQVEGFLHAWGVDVPQSWSEAAQRFDIGAEMLAGVTSPVAAIVGWLLGGTVSFVGALAVVVLIPVFAAYLLHDFDLITAGIRDLIPVYWRPHVVDVAHEIDVVLGEFIRGQVIVMAFLAVAYSSLYALLGVRLALLIGCVAGLVSFIPYVGGAVALGLAVLMCLFNWAGWGQLLGVVLGYAAIQGLEGFVVTPRIVGEKVGLSAIWVLFALLVGGEIFGFMGVLLALPAAAVIKIFVLRALDWYRHSDFYRAPPRPDSSSLLSGIFRMEGLPDDPAMESAKHSLSPRRSSIEVPRGPLP